MVLLTSCMLDKVMQIQFCQINVALEASCSLSLLNVSDLPHTNVLTSNIDCYIICTLQHYVTQDLVLKPFTIT
jgi:hypothetical protein